MNAAMHPSLPTARVAAAACRPRLGLDADGLAYIAHRGGRRFDVDVFNADGSASGVNGNALRCCGRWIHQEYGYGSMLLRQGFTISPVEVDSESVRIRFSITDPPRRAGTGAVSPVVVSIEALEVFVSAPPSAVHGAGPDAPAAARWAPPAQKVLQGNLVRVDRVERSRLEVTTFEVGVRNETLSSTTGALAAVAAGQEFGWLSAGNVHVQSLGGELLVCPEGQGSDYWVDGQVEHVFSGEYRLDLRGSHPTVGAHGTPQL